MFHFQKDNMISLLLATIALSVGKIFPTDQNSPSGKLVQAARLGDFTAVRRCFLDHATTSLCLDSALDAAAAHGHVGIVELLVAFGASDLESALLSAAAHDHVKIAAYLVSKERPNPATNILEAQTLASNTGSLNCEWMLTAHHLRE